MTTQRTVVRQGGRRAVVSKPAAVSASPAARRVVKPTTSSATRPLLVVGEMDLSLPSEKQPPTGSLHTAKIFVHGEPGIGKTEWASCFPDALQLMFEPGAEFLEIFKLPLVGQFTHWSQFIKVVDNLVGNRELNIPPSDKFQKVIIDTADFAWKLGAKYICEAAGVDDINSGDLGYNKGNRKLEEEFQHQILRLTGSGRGVAFISHTKSQSMQKATGVMTDKLIGTLDDKGRRFLNGFCDMTILYGYVGGDRYMFIRGSDAIDAKCRIAKHFYTPEGEQIIAIPCGESAMEAMENFMIAYDNLQEDANDIRRAPELSEVKTKWKGKK